MDISKEFKKIRLLKGWTKKQVSEIFHITPDYVYKIENGIRTPSPRLMKEYCEWAGFSFEEYVDYYLDKNNTKCNT